MSRVEEWRDSFDFNPTRIILGIGRKKKKKNKKIGKERRVIEIKGVEEGKCIRGTAERD